MDDWKWLFNQGISIVVLGFVGIVLWWVLICTKKTGYQGVLISVQG